MFFLDVADISESAAKILTRYLLLSKQAEKIAVCLSADIFISQLIASCFVSRLPYLGRNKLVLVGTQNMVGRWEPVTALPKAALPSRQ